MYEKIVNSDSKLQTKPSKTELDIEILMSSMK